GPALHRASPAGPKGPPLHHTLGLLPQGALSIVVGATEHDVRLVAAVKAGDKAAASSLLRQHVNVNASEPDGTTALHWAVRQEDLQPAGPLIAGGAVGEGATR